jgi:hypothetical protein
MLLLTLWTTGIYGIIHVEKQGGRAVGKRLEKAAFSPACLRK